MMRSFGTWTVAAAILMAMSISGCAEKDPKPAIFAVFEKYQNAALDKQGPQAVEALSQRTVEYYDQALKLALHADIEQLNATPVPQRMLAITIRHELDPEQARSMSGVDVLAWFVESGRMVQEVERDAKLENIQVNGNDATADYVVPGFPTPFPRIFRREGSGRTKEWRNDLIPMFETHVQEMLAAAGAEGAAQENELIYVGLSLHTKKPLTREIWNPPFPREGGSSTPSQ